MKQKILAVLISVALLIALPGTAPTHAQDPEVFEVLVPLDRLQAQTQDGPFGDWLGSITASAAGLVCTTVDVSNTTQDVILQLGLPGQPSVCRQDGAIVTFVDVHGFPFSISMTLRLGTREVLDNLAPVPPDSSPLPATFDVVVPGASLADTTNGATLAESLQRLTAFADGQTCTSADLVGGGDVVLQLGIEGQPEACSRGGAVVTFQDGHEHWLNAWLTLRLNTREVLSNLAPVAPCEPGPCPTPGPAVPATPTTVPTPLPTLSVDRTPIMPPNTGDGGLLP
jgi:hypothetical protein